MAERVTGGSGKKKESIPLRLLRAGSLGLVTLLELEMDGVEARYIVAGEGEREYLIVGGLERERKIAGRDVVGEIPVAGIYDDPDSDGRDQQFMDLQTFFRPNSFQQDKTHPQ
jgi:hypothetical protein